MNLEWYQILGVGTVSSTSDNAKGDRVIDQQQSIESMLAEAVNPKTPRLSLFRHRGQPDILPYRLHIEQFGLVEYLEVPLMWRFQSCWGTWMPDLFGVAAGFIDITPAGPLPLARFYDAHQPVQSTNDRLEVNAVVLRTVDTACVLVSFDLLYVGWELRQMIEARLSERVAAKHLFLNASHTHFAPPTDRRIPKLGPVSTDFLTRVADSTADLVKQLLDSPGQPTTLSYITGQADHAINRRLKVFGIRREIVPIGTHWEMRPNPNGPWDETVRMIMIRNARGAPAAICWGYSCHPVCFPHWDRYSADFPGVVRHAMRKLYGDIPVVFWQGFSGDVRPRIVRPGARSHFGRNTPPSFDHFSDEGWAAWSGTLAERILDISQHAGRPLGAKISAERWATPITKFGLRDKCRDVTVHEIVFGQDVCLFGISAEVTIGHLEVLRQSRAPSDVIPVGCIDAVYGYIPTSEIAKQGGYEARGFMKLFGIHGTYAPDISRLVREHLIDRPRRN